MSLLTICQAAASSSGFSVPLVIVGNNDATAVLLLSLINKSGKALARKPWQVLQKEYAFSTVVSQSDYTLPADYGWFQNDTCWDRSNYWQLRGSLSPQEWQVYKSGIQTTTPRNRFRVKGNLLVIDPTPSAIASMVIEYVSDLWVATSGAPTVGAQDAFAADTDVSLIDEYLLELDLTWRFLERKGLAYLEAKNEAMSEIDKAFAHNAPSNTVNMAGNYDAVWPPLPTVPVTGYS